VICTVYVLHTIRRERGVLSPPVEVSDKMNKVHTTTGHYARALQAPAQDSVCVPRFGDDHLAKATYTNNHQTPYRSWLPPCAVPYLQESNNHARGSST